VSRLSHRSPAARDSRLTRGLRRWAAGLAALAVCAFAAAPALADGLIIVEPRPPQQPHLRNVPLWVKSHKVTVTVQDRVAVTDVDQVFVNPNPRALEGTYIFPLPEGAAIDRFSMWVDGQELSAELLDAVKARGIYEGIVRQMRDPALLEYADRGLFKARIFPIDANGEKRVRIRYAELLRADSGTVAYRYPLATEKFSSRPLQDASISVSISGDSPVASIWSPSHRVDVPTITPGGEGGSGVRVGWEARDVLPDRDFLLYWRPTRKDVGIAALAHRDPGETEGTFLLILSPQERKAAKPLPKDVVFVVDTSGSMAWQKIRQAQDALRFCVRSLGAEDRFGIVPFATEPRPLADTLRAASSDERAAAEKFIDGIEARGGTAIDEALTTAFKMLPGTQDANRPAYVVFLTDGQPTIGETDAAVITKRALANAKGARVFAFGVGNDVNTKLLDVLSDDTRGTRDYVGETESIEEKVSNLWTKVSKPAMTDVSVRVEGVATSAVHPARLPDLFHGSEVLVAGRYTGGGNAVVRLTGKVRGEPVEVVEELKLPEKEGRHAFLPRLWAVRRVGFLLDEIRLHGESAEVKDEVVALAKRFGIVTPYTSYLIVEDRDRPTSRTGGPEPIDGTRSGALPGDPFSAPSAGGGSGGGGGDTMGGGGAPAPSAPALDAESEEILRRAAEKARSAEGQDAGEGAVGLSLETKELREWDGKDDAGGKAGRGARDLLRHVEGRTFARRGGLWWDLRADPAKARRSVKPFSDEYFELVRAHPAIAKYLTLGHVVLVVGEEVVEILPDAE